MYGNYFKAQPHSNKIVSLGELRQKTHVTNFLNMITWLRLMFESKGHNIFMVKWKRRPNIPNIASVHKL